MSLNVIYNGYHPFKTNLIKKVIILYRTMPKTDFSPTTSYPIDDFLNIGQHDNETETSYPASLKNAT